MLKIRLTRMGSNKKPFYRMVVAEERSRRDSSFVEIVGHYNPRGKGDKYMAIDMDRFKFWVSKGAKPTETVRSLVRKAGKQASSTS
jgi:small subunit ribosomal protein S16